MLDREPEVLGQTAWGSTTHHEKIKNGLFPPGLHIGPRAKAWPRHETQAIIAAIIAGKSDDQIRTLVRYLVDQRKKLALMGVIA
ncbi:AlpA family phage regulatory protein [Pseudomaricurvus alcaniphilus]|nr:AlpA family phage regulatory protein [Pseudomaricurvus alcaniphilus]